MLRKAGQTPMLSGSSSAEEGWTDTNTYWITLSNPFALEKRIAPGWISLL